MLYYSFFILLALWIAPAYGSQRCNPALELCISNSGGQLVPVNNMEVPQTEEALVPDVCGVLGGNGASCLGCDGRAYPDHPEQAPRFDHCNVCGGDGTTCCGLGWCSHHGMCVEGACQCRKGWLGVICETAAVLCEDVDCGQSSGHGSCVPQTGECQCVEGFAGHSCQMRNCFPNGAYDHTNDVCKCLPGWEGHDCNKCAKAPERHRYVCTKPRVLRLMEEREAAAGERRGVFWAPDSIHQDVYYDCACQPFDAADRNARALTNQQMEDGLNQLLVVTINRFTSTEDDLNTAIAKTNAANAAAVTNVQWGVIGAALLVFVTAFITSLVMFFIVSYTLDHKSKRTA